MTGGLTRFRYNATVMPLYQILHNGKLFFTDAPDAAEAHRIAVENLGDGEITVTEIVREKKDEPASRKV
jgi:hypothetical protein